MTTDIVTEGLEFSITQEAEADKQEETKDKQIANLVNHPGWLEIVKVMQEKVEFYKKMSGVDTSKMNLEEIGQKFIVSNLVADELQGILNLVTQTANEINKREKK
jgi:predicted enzyme related to lactoylglutathione lyase